MSDRPVYAPLPARAIVDHRLSERHLRTLAVVAAHDRLGKNGVGCWAGHDRLAALVGCDYSRLSTNLRELGEWGYVEKGLHPLNKRLRVYRVLYTPEDGAVMKGVAASDSSPSGKQSRPDSFPNGKDSPPDSLPVGYKRALDSLPNSTGSQSEIKHLGGLNIFPEGEKRSRRNGKRDSAEAAAPPNVGATLAKIERDLKSGRVEADSLPQLHQLLTELADGDFDDPNTGRAYRLADEVFGMLPPDSAGGLQ